MNGELPKLLLESAANVLGGKAEESDGGLRFEAQLSNLQASEWFSLADLRDVEAGSNVPPVLGSVREEIIRRHGTSFRAGLDRTHPLPFPPGVDLPVLLFWYRVELLCAVPREVAVGIAVPLAGGDPFHLSGNELEAVFLALREPATHERLSAERLESSRIEARRLLSLRLEALSRDARASLVTYRSRRSRTVHEVFEARLAAIEENGEGSDALQLERDRQQALDMVAVQFSPDSLTVAVTPAFAALLTVARKVRRKKRAGKA